MGKIHRLPPHEAQKIAAGEVVERPANILKELIENSIDAGATQITVHVEDAGKKLLRVVDNGCGMSADDAQLCFERHATSKIQQIDQLEEVETYGFRGEALASIAAVAQITLHTKRAEMDEGICVSVSQNKVTNTTPSSSPIGTDITIADLFCTIPARKKFLKKRETEWRHLTQLVHAFCLSHPHIHFKLFNEGKEHLNCAPASELVNRCAQLWSNDGQEWLSIESSSRDNSVTITGVISSHQSYRYDRNGIFTFVNNRWVSNFKLSRALLNGYQNILPQGRYPSAILSITIDPTLIDINVHPRKEEVAFLHPRTTEQLITQSVRHALEQRVSKQIAKPVSFRPAEESLPPHAATQPSTFIPFDFDTLPSNPFQTGKQVGEYRSHAESSPSPTVAPLNTTPPQTTAPLTTTPAQQPNELTVVPEKADRAVVVDHHIIGQFHQTYILVDHEEGLLIIDQHAAHERVLYELFVERFGELPTIKLLFPQNVQLKQEDIDLLSDHLEVFTSNGILIEQRSSDHLSIEATPVHLKDVSVTELIKEAIGWLKEEDDLDHEALTKKMHEKLRAQMACKAAIKAGDTLSITQMQQLLRDLDSVDNRDHCPHGRPTSWFLPLSEIERKIRRRK